MHHLSKPIAVTAQQLLQDRTISQLGGGEQSGNILIMVHRGTSQVNSGRTRGRQSIVPSGAPLSGEGHGTDRQSIAIRPAMNGKNVRQKNRATEIQILGGSIKKIGASSLM
jgi:hypothetical protein